MDMDWYGRYEGEKISFPTARGRNVIGTISRLSEMDNNEAAMVDESGWERPVVCEWCDSLEDKSKEFRYVLCGEDGANFLLLHHKMFLKEEITNMIIEIKERFSFVKENKQIVSYLCRLKGFKQESCTMISL